MPAPEPTRQDPFANLDREPASALGLTAPPVLAQPPAGRRRRTPLRPSEKRRRARKLTVTFSSPDLPRRLQDLARRWHMLAPDRTSPNVSALVEYLLLPRLEAAERGQLAPPPEPSQEGK
jgi:hypothetical protein